MDLPWEKVYEYTWNSSDSDDEEDVKKHDRVSVCLAVGDLRSTTTICAKNGKNGSTTLRSAAFSGIW